MVTRIVSVTLFGSSYRKTRRQHRADLEKLESDADVSLRDAGVEFYVDVDKVHSDFPILRQRVHGKALV
jgi:hypothetical protein